MNLKHNSSGSVLFLAVVFSLMLGMIGMAHIYMNATEEIVTKKDVNSVRALYLAEAGIERSVAWLRSMSIPSGTTDPFGEVLLQPEPSGAPGYFRVSIKPGIPDPTKTYRTIVITSIGSVGVMYAPGSIAKTITRTVFMENDAKYALFTASESISGAGAAGRIFFHGADKFEGPVCSSDVISICGNPKFSTDTVTGLYQVAAKNYWFYSTLGLRGSGTPAADVETTLSNTTSYPSKTPSNIFGAFSADFSALQSMAGTASMSGQSWKFSGNRTVTIQNNGRIDVTGAPTCNVTTSSGAVIFIEGNATIQSGMSSSVYRKLTVPLTIAATGNVTIASTLLCTRDVSDTRLTSGPLGIVTPGDIVLVSAVPVQNVSTGVSSITACVEIDALMMCRSFRAQDWNTRADKDIDPSVKTPTIFVWGGIVEQMRGEVGAGYASNNATDLVAGYKKWFRYDTRLSGNLPPYFPIPWKLSRQRRVESPLQRY